MPVQVQGNGLDFRVSANARSVFTYLDFIASNKMVTYRRETTINSPFPFLKINRHYNNHMFTLYVHDASYSHVLELRLILIVDCFQVGTYRFLRQLSGAVIRNEVKNEPLCSQRLDPARSA